MPACGTSVVRVGPFRSGGEGPNAFSGSGFSRVRTAERPGLNLMKRAPKGSAQTLGPHGYDRRSFKTERRLTLSSKLLYQRMASIALTMAVKTWVALDRSQNMIWRPFYYANLIVDPKDENKIYKPGGSLIASNDGARASVTFRAARMVTFTTSGSILNNTII